MSNHSFVLEVLAGLGRNLLIVLLSSVLPVAAGTGLTFALKAIRNRGARIAIRLAGAAFYCLVPSVLLLTLYWVLFPQTQLELAIEMWAVLALSISHIGYFAMRYDNNASVKKNLVVNTLGVLSSTFMWSTTAGYIGVKDVFWVCGSFVKLTYNFAYYGFALLICFSVLAALIVPRMILKEKMQ